MPRSVCPLEPHHAKRAGGSLTLRVSWAPSVLPGEHLQLPDFAKDTPRRQAEITTDSPPLRASHVRHSRGKLPETGMPPLLSPQLRLTAPFTGHWPRRRPGGDIGPSFQEAGRQGDHNLGPRIGGDSQDQRPGLVHSKDKVIELFPAGAAVGLVLGRRRRQQRRLGTGSGHRGARRAGVELYREGGELGAGAGHRGNLTNCHGTDISFLQSTATDFYRTN